MQQWTKEKSREWFQSIPYPFGCNFLPSTAVNSTEMWQNESFDTETMERELRLACGLGYNTVRVFLPFIVWDDGPDSFKERFSSFLEIADACGITMMPILFDDCAFEGVEPYLGKQRDPMPGVHNSRWTASPGTAVKDNPNAWSRLEEYVQDLVGSFGKDPRVLVWDLYNEPGNSGSGEKSMPLLQAVFQWAREANPEQPLTAGVWGGGAQMQAINTFCEEQSDVVSFHSYYPAKATGEMIDSLSRHERPLFCTEWLHRPMGSRIQTHLGLFNERNVGIYNWGLALGKTQTNLNWYTMTGSPNPEPREWQHDLLFPDGAVYDHEEIAIVRNLVGEDLIMKPVEMTPEVMQDLEDRGLIIRLRPGAHPLTAAPGETLGESLYESGERFGPHKLITVTVNREEFAGFATHPDNEEFFLLGSPDTKPMFLAVALCMREEFEEKVRSGCLKPEDLVLLRCRYNDPQVSFFVMLKDVPHGEAIVEADLPPATFYVTESRDLPLDVIEMRKYRLKVATG